MTVAEKRPRQYAAEIAPLPVKTWGEEVERRVPEAFREWVKDYLRAVHRSRRRA